MIFIKNKLLILMFVTYVLPLGGIGISAIGNIHTINHPENDIEGRVSLSVKSDNLQYGANWFIYLDIPLSDFSVEYSRESKVQWLSSELNWEEQFGEDYTEAPGGTATISGDIPTNIKSQYFTLRKEIVGLSIPFLAKAALHLGGGYNVHNSLIPNIDILEDLFNVSNPEGVYSELASDWDLGINDLGDIWDQHSKESNGVHIQASIQGSILMLNLFANAKYTFILEDNDSKIESFPGVSIGIAYGI